MIKRFKAILIGMDSKTPLILSPDTWMPFKMTFYFGSLCSIMISSYPPMDLFFVVDGLGWCIGHSLVVLNYGQSQIRRSIRNAIHDDDRTEVKLTSFTCAPVFFG